MRIIPLLSVPNQRISVVLDGIRWEIEIKQANASTTATVYADDELVIQGVRIVPGTPILPYPYLMAAGNFLMLTELEQIPTWENFESDQTFVYLTAEEISEYAQ